MSSVTGLEILAVMVSTLAALDVEVIVTLLGLLLLTSGGSLASLLIGLFRLFGSLGILACDSSARRALFVSARLSLRLLLLFLGLSQVGGLHTALHHVVAFFLPLLELLLVSILSELENLKIHNILMKRLGSPKRSEFLTS